MVRTSWLGAVVVVVLLLGVPIVGSVGASSPARPADAHVSTASGVDVDATTFATPAIDVVEPHTVVHQTATLGAKSGELVSAAVGAVIDHPPVVPVVAGYSRFDDSDPLAHQTRNRIHAAVVERPGLHLAGVATALGEPLSTVRYHSRVLESEGLIDAEKRAGRKRLFPVDVDTMNRALRTALAHESRQSVLLAVAESEPVNVSSVADALDKAPSTVTYHLAKLEEDGLVERTRVGESVLTSLDADVRATLNELE